MFFEICGRKQKKRKGSSEKQERILVTTSLMKQPKNRGKTTDKTRLEKIKFV